MSNRDVAKVLALVCAITVPMEGTRQWAYRDVTGLPTICMGHTKGVKMGDFRTIPECQAMLTLEMRDVIKTVDQCQPGLPDGVLAAFADAAYNLGPTIACDVHKSTAAKFLAVKNYPAACEQLPRWDKARVAGVAVVLPGLTKRRELERVLCLG